MANLTQEQQQAEITPEQQKELNQTLFVSVAYNKPEAISDLVKKGADVNAKVSIHNNDDYSYPIIRAAHFGKTKNVNTLTDNGADVNAVCSSGNTALHNVMFQTHDAVKPESYAECGKLLLDKGANPFIENKAGETVANLAYEQYQQLRADGKTIPDHIQMIKTMDESRKMEQQTAPEQQKHDEQWQGKIDQELYDASESSNTEEIKSLIKAGADVNAQVPYGVEGYEIATPLANAAYHGQIESMATLVEHGADINKVSGPLGTPMHAAFHNNQQESAKWLLDNGASPFIKDHDGQTVADLAYEQYQQLRADGKEIPDHIQMIKKLDEGRKLETPEQQQKADNVAPPSQDVKVAAYSGTVTAPPTQNLKSISAPATHSAPPPAANVKTISPSQQTGNSALDRLDSKAATPAPQNKPDDHNRPQ